MDGWALQLLAATNWWLWAGAARGMCHLPLRTKNRVCARAVGGGGGCSPYYGINPGEGGIKGGNGRRCGGGGMMGQTPWRHPRGGGMTGQTPWRHPPRGGGWDKHPGATPLPHPDEECESCRGKGGGKARDNNQGETGGGDSKEM